MTLSVEAIEWAVQFVADHSDGDLFPRVSEMAAIRDGEIRSVMINGRTELIAHLS